MNESESTNIEFFFKLRSESIAIENVLKKVKMRLKCISSIKIRLTHLYIMFRRRNRRIENSNKGRESKIILYFSFESLGRKIK